MEQSIKSRVSELLAEIHKLEDELEDAIRTREVDFLYRVDGTKIRFERAVEDAHRKLKVGLLRWLGDASLRNIASAPFIYAMIIPFTLLDLFVSTYQAVCFPLYRIPKVPRSQYIVIDRHQLSYVNAIEKLNCIYCGYVNGLIAYVREISARTEQYWCPIKHARKVLDPHRRYARFADFGDSGAFQDHVAKMRRSLRKQDD